MYLREQRVNNVVKDYGNFDKPKVSADLGRKIIGDYDDNKG